MSGNLFIKIGFFLAVLILPVFVVLPYFNAGYFPTHDGEWAVVRLADMFRTLRDLQFPARFSGALNFGYGYPLFNFAYPFPYYLGVLLYVPLQSFILSIKVIFAGSVILSSVFMYLASYQLWKSRLAALISAIFYVYLPYRMLDLYVRGSIGESLSFALFPLILLFSLKLLESPYSRVSVVMLSLLIAALVMTHNIMTVLFLPLLGVFIFLKSILDHNKIALSTFALSIVIGIGISCFFWFPALYEKSNILLSQIPIADRDLYFVKPWQLAIPSWGYAPPTEQGGFSYQLGLAHIGVQLISFVVLLFALLRSKLTQTPVKQYALVLFSLYILCILMMFSFTKVIWENVPLLSEINYPWTMLSQVGFITALLAGFLVTQKRFVVYMVITLSVFAIVLTWGYAKPESYNNFSDDYYLTNEATTTSSSELTPLWVKERPNERYISKIESVNANLQISDLSYNSNTIRFQYTSDVNPVIRINTIYYPGWRAYINGQPVEISYSNPKGVMEIKGTRLSDTVVLKFTETLPRTIANGISLVSLLVLGFILLRPLLRFK